MEAEPRLAAKWSAVKPSKSEDLKFQLQKNTSSKVGHHTILVKAYYHIWGVLGEVHPVGYPQNNYFILIIREELYTLGFLHSPIFEGRLSCLGRRLIDTDSPKNDSKLNMLNTARDYAKNSIPWLVCEHL